MPPKPISAEEIRDEVSRQLGIPTESIDPSSDLIGLGLDSIRMMKLAGGWRKRGFDVNFADLASSPSVRRWHDMLVGRAVEQAAPATPAETAEPAGDTFPLAPMQHAYWVGRSDGQELGGVAAHLYVEFDGSAVDPTALATAVAALVELHPMLRTQFTLDGTQRTLAEPGRAVFDVIDLSSLSSAEVDERLDAIRLRKTHQRMAVEDGQVLDVTLGVLPGGRSRLHLDVDMLAADAMSYRVLVDDLAHLYSGTSRPHTAYTFRQYLESAASQPSSSSYARDRQWWADRLPELPSAPTLPLVPETERAEPNTTVRLHHWIDADTKQRLFAQAQSRGVTPAMALASVFAETIGRFSSEQRFLLNLPLFQREPVHADVERLVGDFTSSVLLDVDLSESATVAERAEALQRTMHAAGAHSGYSGLEVLRDLGRHRGESVLAPIVYTSALNLGELFSSTVTDAFGSPAWIISQGPQVLLDAQVTEMRGGVLLNWDVRESAFRPGVVQAMFDRYTAAIDGLGTAEYWNADAAGDIPADQRAVRRAVDDTAAARTGATLHKGAFEHATRTPERPAVIWGSGESWTYGELADGALRIAGALAEIGVQSGDAVAVQLPKGPDQILAVLGVLAAGAVYVPVGFDQPEQRRARILEVGDVVAALTVDPAAYTSTSVPALAIADAAQCRSPRRSPKYPDHEQVAYVLFTSGSTGTPKGVEVPHRAAMNTIEDLLDRFGVGSEDRSLAVSALEFDLSVFDIFGLLTAGGTIVATQESERHDPQAWVTSIRTHDVTVLNCVPSILEMVLATGGPSLDNTLRVAILGGDWVGVDLPRRVARQIPGCRFAGLGGATETAIHSTICEVVEPDEHWGSVPYGVPLGNVQCRVVGSSGRDCPDWVTGELWIGGDGVAHGYRHDAERTAERFLTISGQRWYRTGDLARYWPDGTLEFLGRADQQVKVRGFRIELGEVEAALRSIDRVHSAVAAVVGTAAPKLVAAITASGGDVDPATELAAILPAYMIPERVVTLDEFPLTPNGKLDRTALRVVLDADAGDVLVSSERVPRTRLEEALAHLFADVLSRDAVGVTDDFFSLGGDSVLATAAVARIREWLAAPHATVSDMFAARTVEDLAVRLEDRDAATGRLEQVAEVYLEIAAMDDAEVAAAVG